MTDSSHATPLRLAALIHPDDRHDMETFLERAARRLQADGWRVGGLVHRQSLYPNGNKRMRLFDLRSEASFELTQDLGPSSQACSLNPQSLAEASEVLRAALAEPVDLVVINRFGMVEAEGRGFAQEFAALVEAGIPVLTAVAHRHAAYWSAFTGDEHAVVPADEEAIVRWCEARLRERGVRCENPLAMAP